MAILRPLLKKSNLEHIDSNYRPVSDLLFLSKIVENATMDQIVAHTKYNDITPRHQSTYKANHSCETLLIKLINNLLA